jgi:hypothetical protein
LQTAPLGQVIPQPPQLRGSLPVMFAHEPLGHWVVPVAQLVAQALALQTWPDGQALPQLPQLVAEDDTQAPPQLSSPAWH